MSSAIAIAAIGLLAAGAAASSSRGSASGRARSASVYSFQIVPAGEDAYDDEGEDFDEDDAHRLLRDAKINPGRSESLAFVALHKGEVVGALFASSPLMDEQGYSKRFTVVVSPHVRRMGVGRALVQAMEEQTKGAEVDALGSVRVEAWVINPLMAELLRGLGYEEDYRGWSQDSPFMEKRIQG
jgi:ribosomal protein S18 acetylase RimI-like enzyme